MQDYLAAAILIDALPRGDGAPGTLYVESGHLEIEHIECSPVSVAAEVVSLMRVRAKQKNLSFDFEFAGPVPENVRTDPIRVRQVLVNLIGNAVKFTESGGVRLIGRYLGPGSSAASAAEAGLLQFDVVDSGPGISPSQSQRLCQPFSQADASTTRKYGGKSRSTAKR